LFRVSSFDIRISAPRSFRRFDNAISPPVYRAVEGVAALVRLSLHLRHLSGKTLFLEAHLLYDNVRVVTVPSQKCRRRFPPNGEFVSDPKHRQRKNPYEKKAPFPVRFLQSTHLDQF
jgi:hypothetical protein